MARWRASVVATVALLTFSSSCLLTDTASATTPVRIALSRHSHATAATDPAVALVDDTTTTPTTSHLRQAADAFRHRQRRRHLLPAFARNKTVALKNYGNVQYVGRVAFGNPPQLLSVVFDTGSSDTWVPGTDCAHCGSHTLFDPAQSTTFLDTQEKFIDAYGSGSVAGTVVVDTVMLGSYKVDSVKFGVVHDETEKLRAFIADGIFGLAFEGLAQVSRPTLFTSLADQNPAIDNMFAFYLTPDAYRAGSELHVGGYDLSLVGANASFHYTPVVKLPEFDTYMYWTVRMNHFSTSTSTTNGSKENLCSPFCYAIVDTGTSLISIPQGQYHDVLQQITTGLRCEDVTCQGVALDDFPTLRFGMVPDNMFQLQPRDYVQCIGWGTCRLQLQSTSDEWWILGDVFIKTYYTLFDAQNMRVGFACNGDVCSGGRGDIHGGYDDDDGLGDPLFRALENAFLIGSCFAAACMFLFVFYMNQQGDDADEELTHQHHQRPYSGQNDPKMPLLYTSTTSTTTASGGGGSSGITSPRGGGAYVAPQPTIVDLSKRRAPSSTGTTGEPTPTTTSSSSSYEEARRNFSDLPPPHSYQNQPQN